MYKNINFKNLPKTKTLQTIIFPEELYDDIITQLNINDIDYHYKDINPPFDKITKEWIKKFIQAGVDEDAMKYMACEIKVNIEPNAFFQECTKLFGHNIDPKYKKHKEECEKRGLEEAKEVLKAMDLKWN